MSLLSDSYEGYTLELPSGRDAQGKVGGGALSFHLCSEQPGGSESVRSFSEAICSLPSASWGWRYKVAVRVPLLQSYDWQFLLSPTYHLPRNYLAAPSWGVGRDPGVFWKESVVCYFSHGEFQSLGTMTTLRYFIFREIPWCFAQCGG